MKQEKIGGEIRKLRELKDFENIENELFWDFVLEEVGVFVTQGANGVIVKVDLTQLRDEVKKMLKERGLIKGELSAVKILKVYTKGDGWREAMMQEKAYALYKKHPDTAHIPSVHFNFTMPATDTIRSFLGPDAQVKDKVEVVIMDFVEGVDLATLMYRYIIRHHKKTQHIRDVDDLPMERLQEIIPELLGFETAERKGSSQEMKEKIRAVENANAEKVYTALENFKFILPAHLFETMRKTLVVWRGNDFHHNDLHERNIMITPDNEVYIVDFGASHPDNRLEEPRLDVSMQEVLRYFIRTKEEREEIKREKEKANFENTLKIFKEDPRVERLIALLREQPLSFDAIAEKSRMLMVSSEKSLREFALLTVILIREGLVSSEDAHTFFNEKIRTTKQPAIVNLFKKYKTFLDR